MNIAQVQNVIALPRLVIDNTPSSFSSARDSEDLVDLFKDPESLDDLEKLVDFACAAQPIFQDIVDAFESHANEYTEPVDPDGETVAFLEENEEQMKRIRGGVVSLSITECLRRTERNFQDQRVLNQLLRFQRTFHPFIRNLQRYRWTILSVDGGLAPSTGRTFDSADEFVKAQLEEA